MRIRVAGGEREGEGEGKGEGGRLSWVWEFGWGCRGVEVL